MGKPSFSPESTAEADQQPKAIRVLLADRHALVRAGIRALLERIDGVEVVAEGSGGRQILESVKEFDPDVLLLDLTMRAHNGLELLREIASKFPRVGVIVLTAQETEEFGAFALRAGASGFLSKNAASDELELAVKAVASGQEYVASEVSKRPTLKYLDSAPSAAGPRVLTARQKEVLQMIAEGHATKEIARRLNISVKTVESHRAQTMERLNIHDVAGLVRYAIRTGLVEIDQ